MADYSLFSYVLASIIPCIFLYRWLSMRSLYAVPTIGGPSAPVLSYLGAFRLVHHGQEMLQEGYDKYKGGMFKIAMLDRWLVVISGPKLIEELRKMPDEQVSLLDAASDVAQTRFTFGKEVIDTPYHVDIIRAQLTRHLATVFPDVRDEIVTSFNELVPPSDNWTAVSTLHIIRNVVARVSNRVFIGLPMCRHPDYIKLAIRHTMDVSTTRKALAFFPNFLKPLAAYFVNDSQRSIKEGVGYLKPLILDRQRKLAEYGDDWLEKPNDLLMWLIEEATARKQSVDVIVQMVLLINFAAIHTSSNSFTHALYHLAANPGYLQPLREEVETAVKEEGWTKAAMNKLRKLDSFMRESQRMNGINGISVMRKTLGDITFSNGAHIPAGTLIVAASTATHMDEENYPNPDVFDPFRFANMRGEDGESTKHQFVSTSVEYIPFGHGKHACPGRFFAANELKAMMAHVVINYDVKFKNEGVRPPNEWFAVNVVPSPNAEVLFRRRQA